MEKCLTVHPCPSVHWIPAVGPSYPEFVFPGCWHFINGAMCFINDVGLNMLDWPIVFRLLSTWKILYAGLVEGIL